MIISIWVICNLMDYLFVAKKQMPPNLFLKVLGIKAKDIYGSTTYGKGCNERCGEDLTKEKEDLEVHLNEEMNSKLAKLIQEKFAQMLQLIGTPQQSNIIPTTTIQSQTSEK